MPYTYGGGGTGQWITLRMTSTAITSGNITYPLPSITSGTTLAGAPWPTLATRTYIPTGFPMHLDTWTLWNAIGEFAEPPALDVRGRAQAHSRAAELLRLLLTPDQWRAYQQHEAFEVVGSLGRRYRIRHGVSGNIAILEDGYEVARICAHPEVYDRANNAHLPTEDVLIGQLLHLTSDEASFLRVANVHAGRIPELRAA